MGQLPFTSFYDCLLFIFLQDMILTLSILLRGSNREKLKWIFSRLYDLNGNGYITKLEFFNIISAIHDLVGVSKQVSLSNFSRL